MAAGGVGEMEEEESAEDLTPVVKDWMRSNYIKGEVAEEEAEQVDNFENAIANPETDEEQMEEEEGGGEPKSKCPKKKMLAQQKEEDSHVIAKGEAGDEEETLEEYAAETAAADVAKMGFAGPGHFKERRKRAKKVAGPGSFPLPPEEEEEEEEEEEDGATGETWAALKKKTRQPKKRPKSQEESWVCEECTYINDAKDFKCEMCFAPRTTSKGRKARRDPGVVQERVQQELLQEELDKRVGYKEPPLPMISDVRNVFTDEEMKERYRCNQCDAHFSAPGNLARHKLTEHEGVRYSCDLCPAIFSASTNLKRHKLTKHEGATYDCYACHKQFGNHGTLKRHVQSQH